MSPLGAPARSPPRHPLHRCHDSLPGDGQGVGVTPSTWKPRGFPRANQRENCREDAGRETAETDREAGLSVPQASGRERLTDGAQGRASVAERHLGEAGLKTTLSPLKNGLWHVSGRPQLKTGDRGTLHTSPAR